MATYDNSSPMGVTQLPAPPFWVCVLLGLVMIVAEFLVLGDVMLVTVISTIFIGWVSIIRGRLRDRPRVLDQGMGRVCLAGVARHPVHRL